MVGQTVSNVVIIRMGGWFRAVRWQDTKRRLEQRSMACLACTKQFSNAYRCRRIVLTQREQLRGMR